MSYTPSAAVCGPSFPSPLETSLAAPVELRKQVEFPKRPRDPFAVGAINFFQRPASETAAVVILRYQARQVRQQRGAMPVSFPYAGVVVAALGAVAVLTAALNLIQGDWMAAVFLAVVIVFTVIALSLLGHALIVAISSWWRRRGDDRPGSRDDYGLAA